MSNLSSYKIPYFFPLAFASACVDMPYDSDVSSTHDERLGAESVCVGEIFEMPNQDSVVDNALSIYAEELATARIREYLERDGAELPDSTGTMKGSSTHVVYCELNRKFSMGDIAGKYSFVDGQHTVFMHTNYFDAIKTCVTFDGEDVVGVQKSKLCDEFIGIRIHEQTHALQNIDSNSFDWEVPGWLREREADEVGLLERADDELYVIHEKWEAFVIKALEASGVEAPKSFLRRRMHLSRDFLLLDAFEGNFNPFTRKWFEVIFSDLPVEEVDKTFVAEMLAEPSMKSNLWLKTQELMDQSKNLDFWEEKILSKTIIDFVNEAHSITILADDFSTRRKNGKAYTTSSLAETKYAFEKHRYKQYKKEEKMVSYLICFAIVFIILGYLDSIRMNRKRAALDAKMDAELNPESN